MSSRMEETERLLNGRDDPFSMSFNGNSSHLSSRRSSVSRSSTRRQYLAALLILLIELAERLTYYSLISNIVLLSTSSLSFTSLDAVTINLVFTSVSYFLPVFGGIVSDIFLGYFNTIYAAGLTYVVGAACFPLLTFDYAAHGVELTMNGKRALFFIGLILISVGTGGIKCNVGPFGAEQLQNAGPHATQTYFTWFYWFINVGAFIAYSLVAYIQQEDSLFYGYLIPTGLMALAVTLLVCTKSIYKVRQPTGSVLPKIFHLIYNAFRVKRVSILHEDHTLDYARRRNGGNYSDNDVDDVKALVHLFPIFLTCIMGWVVYNQMGSTFFLQGERMNIRLGSLNLPAASLNIFDAATILILVPIMDRLLYPFLDRFNLRPSQLVRMGIGMIFFVLSMIMGGILEIYRKEDIALHGPIQQVLAGETFNASSLSILYQVPQFMFVGTGEIFLVLTGQEFAFSESPESMKAAVMGMFLVTNGFGSLMGSVAINIANAISKPNDWVPDEINDGYLENYAFLLAGLMFLNLLVYIFIARRYKYNNLRALRTHVAEYTRNNGFMTSSGSSDDEVHLK